MDFFSPRSVPVTEIDLRDFGLSGVSLSVKREDLLHPHVSGNKFRKLKFNLLAAREQRHDTLLTFGGAYSNHITAVAAAGKETGFKTIGIIRGEELQQKINTNPGLRFARSCGMKLLFISRELYRQKEDPGFLEELQNKFGRFYLLPEGGTNELAVRGCAEIPEGSDFDFDYMSLAVGTGGTMAGLIKASDPDQTVLGFSVLKGVFQKEILERYECGTNYELTDQYSFGGYGKIDSGLIRFMNEFKRKTQIPLDPVYTGKMMYGIFDRIKNGYFKKNNSILAVHTGGLQGISGMNRVLKKKNLPQIE